MTACVIVHNMIIENEDGQNLNYIFHDLVGVRVWPSRRQDLIERFMQVYHDIRVSNTSSKRYHVGVVGMA